MEIKVKALRNGAFLPTYGSTAAAGADLYIPDETSYVLAPHETTRIPLGIAMEIPDGYAGFIFARSGLACKLGIAPANKVGVIDSDYRGEIVCGMHNHSNSTVTLNGGDRIAQIVFLPVEQATFTRVETLSETARGTGGFGSTGR